MNYITTYLCGGLGNQMFQYAAGRALALRCRAELRLNVAWYSAPRADATPRQFSLNVFPNACGEYVAEPWPEAGRLGARLMRRMRFALPFAIRGYVPEPSFNYWSGIQRVQAPAQILGFWQSEKYFEHAAQQIRADFAFSDLSGDAGLEVRNKIAVARHSISVHVRMGDYVSNPSAAMHNIITPQYYSRALRYFYENYGPCSLFLFSDEPDKAASFFDPQGHELTIVDTKAEAHHDMHLMSLCRHHIIANSSFSWWGAWLGSNDGVTIAPSRWFAPANTTTADVCPASWLRMEP